MSFAWVMGTFVLAYGLGSIPFGLLLTKAAGLGDLRRIGSGNIGATNVLRSGHKFLAFLTLLLDGGKGWAAVILTDFTYSHSLAPAAGFFAVLGHIFPVWLSFKGGKGVATTLGVFLALNWVFGVVVCAMWLSVFAFTRISSLAAIISIGYSSVAAYLLDDYMTALLCLNLAVLIIFTHTGNIKRLLQGTEHHFRSETL